MQINGVLAYQKYNEASMKLQEAQAKLNSAPTDKKSEAQTKYNQALTIFNTAQSRMLESQGSESTNNKTTGSKLNCLF